MPTVRTKTERRFNPHLLLLRGAQHHLTRAKEKTEGWYYDWLGAIVLAALSIEAIGNSYGKVLIPNWNKLISDRIAKRLGASPKWKLETVANRCGINPDYNSHPWFTVRKLTEFRDLIAHATRKHLKVEHDCTLTDYGRIFGARLESDVEAMITEDFATQSCDAVELITTTINKTLNIAQLYELAHDGHESHAQVLPNEKP